MIAAIERGENVSVDTLEKLAAVLAIDQLPLGRITLAAEKQTVNLSHLHVLAEKISMASSELLTAIDGRRPEAVATRQQRVPPKGARRRRASPSADPLADILAIPDGPFRPPTLRVVDDDWVDVIVEGRIAAGPPIDYEVHETARVPPEAAPELGWRVMEAWGDSMIDVGIESGDLVYVERRVGGVAATGETVIGWLNDGLVIKKWEHRKKRRWLISENPEIAPREIGPDDYWELRAIVRQVVKRGRARVIQFPNISGKHRRRT